MKDIKSIIPISNVLNKVMVETLRSVRDLYNEHKLHTVTYEYYSGNIPHYTPPTLDSLAQFCEDHLHRYPTSSDVELRVLLEQYMEAGEVLPASAVMSLPIVAKVWDVFQLPLLEEILQYIELAESDLYCVGDVQVSVGLASLCELSSHILPSHVNNFRNFIRPLTNKMVDKAFDIKL